MAKKNGTIWKVIGTLLGSGLVITIAVWIWQASTIASQVESNCGQIKEIKPIVAADHEAIIKIEMKIDEMKRSFAAMSKNFEDFEDKQQEYKNEIIKEIRGLADGN